MILFIIYCMCDSVLCDMCVCKYVYLNVFELFLWCLFLIVEIKDNLKYIFIIYWIEKYFLLLCFFEMIILSIRFVRLGGVFKLVCWFEMKKNFIKIELFDNNLIRV